MNTPTWDDPDDEDREGDDAPDDAPDEPLDGGDDDADDLDEDFPLGDGTAETDAVVACPYCGEAVEITLDPGSGSDQEYVEDCEVCCRPWRVRVRYDRFGHADVEAVGEDD